MRYVSIRVRLLEYWGNVKLIVIDVAHTDCNPGPKCDEKNRGFLKRNGLDRRKAYCDLSIGEPNEGHFDPDNTISPSTSPSDEPAKGISSAPSDEPTKLHGLGPTPVKSVVLAFDLPHPAPHFRNIFKLQQYLSYCILSRV